MNLKKFIISCAAATIGVVAGNLIIKSIEKKRFNDTGADDDFYDCCDCCTDCDIECCSNYNSEKCRMTEEYNAAQTAEPADEELPVSEEAKKADEDTGWAESVYNGFSGDK